jgi:hypothetical protein
MSDTPETGGLALGNHVAPTEFAQDLERQLRKARDWVFRLRKHRAIARNFGNQMERERDHWKSESLEQAKLLAMSADREERLRAKIVGWENKWRCAVEMAALAEMKLHDVNVAKQ